jgi:aminoglycoside phosphotransferase (APT) family kinase protein
MREPSEVIVDIVRKALGERVDRVEHVPTLEDSDVFRVHLAGCVVYFKAEHEGHPIDIAAWAYEKAASVGVPVPEVLHIDLTREQWPREFIVISAVSGTDLEHDPLEGRDLIEAIEGYGRLLRRLHSVTLEGFGDLVFPDPSATDPVGPFPDHASHVRASPDWAFPYVLERALVNADVADRVREVIARHDELVEGPARGVLVHDDPGLDHLFIEREHMQITGLIDFEPRSADPVWDLATFAFHYPHVIDHLIKGYGSCPDDLDLRLELYGLVRAIGCARWDHERGFDIDRTCREIERRSAGLLALLG